MDMSNSRNRLSRRLARKSATCMSENVIKQFIRTKSEDTTGRNTRFVWPWATISDAKVIWVGLLSDQEWRDMVIKGGVTRSSGVAWQGYQGWRDKVIRSGGTRSTGVAWQIWCSPNGVITSGKRVWHITRQFSTRRLPVQTQCCYNLGA